MLKLNTTSHFEKDFLDKKVLVLGSSGFIGSHLQMALKKAGAKTFSLSRRNNAFLLAENQYIFDIRETSQLKKVIASNQFDYIFNCVGFSGEINNQKNPELSYQINFEVKKNVADLIIKYSPNSKYVVCGTRLEYGRSIYLPVDELHPINPLGNYGKNHLLSTEYLLSLKKDGLKVVILRISNTYGYSGGGLSNNYNIINNFVSLANKGRDLTVFGDGSQLRDYVYIDDLIKALIISASKKNFVGLYNVGYGNSISFFEMVNKIALKFGVKVNKKNWPAQYKKFETGDYVTNINSFSDKTGWFPEIDFDSGIEKIRSEICQRKRKY